MDHRARVSLVGLAISLLVGGCANWDSIYREEGVGSESEHAKVMFIDAKQRAILTAKRPAVPKTTTVTTADGKTTTTQTYVESYRAFCAEPSPDVYSVLSQAASASGSFGQDATSMNAAIAAAMSSAETGSTISRTQTINMLRELMYRTCERYMSGALDDLQFPIQAIRDQHVMVSILAIEQLTGSITPPVVSLSSSGNAGEGQNTSDAIVRLDDAWKTLQTANSDEATKQGALDDLDKAQSPPGVAGSTCKAIDASAAKATPPKYDDTTNDPLKAPKCTAAEADLAKAKDAQKQAQDHYDTLKGMADKGGTASASAFGQANVTSVPADPNRAAIVQGVANVVQEIVDQNFKQDEFLLFCIRAMQTGQSGQITDNCVNYVKDSVSNQSAKLAADTARLQLDAATSKRLSAQAAAEQQAYDQKSAAHFAPFWKKVVSDGDPQVADSKRLTKVIDVYLSAHPSTAAKGDLVKLEAETSISKVFEIFDGLPLPRQKDLAQ